MANTVIQLKYSTVTATPTALNIAEPAYSYTSNTLFIGSPAGTGAIAIGGKFYLDQQQNIYDYANAAFATANAAGSSALVQYAAAHANSSFHQANAAYAQANTNATNITVIQGVNASQNNEITYAENHANSAFHQANAAYAQANTNATNITVIQGVNVTQNTNITTAQNTATAAFIRANNSLNANTGGVITGPVTVAANLTITGNLTVIGNTITTNVETLNIADPLIYLAANNYSGDAVEIGFAANYYDGSTNRHTGVFREASNKEFYVFDNYTPEPTGNLIDINDASFRVATLNANLKSQSITLNGRDLQTYVNESFHKANAAYAQANTTQTFAGNAFNQANAAYAQANTNATSITVIQGVNVTQNTNTTNAQNKADSAFHQANAAFSLANGTAGIANTDFTNVNISAADYGSASAVASFRVAANGRIISANSTSIAISAAAITSGTLGVARGGTGATTFTTNGVLLGQGTGGITTASSSTEGHLLTINSSGVPAFMHLQGGTF